MSNTGIAVMIGKGCIVLLGLLIAVIAWRWRNGIEVKHSPRRLVSDANRLRLRDGHGSDRAARGRKGKTMMPVVVGVGISIALWIWAFGDTLGWRVLWTAVRGWLNRRVAL